MKNTKNIHNPKSYVEHLRENVKRAMIYKRNEEILIPKTEKHVDRKGKINGKSVLYRHHDSNAKKAQTKQKQKTYLLSS